jgi:tripartite-type tricarboxylate transporter receptor subunit TctC
MIRPFLIKNLVSCCLALFFSSLSFAQWPNRPVTLVVPFAAGGPSDIVGREIAQELQRSLGQPFLVDNRTGGGGAVGAQFVVRSAADGYTLLLRTGYPLAAINGGLGFDPNGDFAVIGIVGETPYFLVARSGAQLSSIALVQQVGRTRELSIATPGTATTSHVGAAIAAKMLGVRWSNVPYRGNAPMLTDLAGGHTDLAVVAASALASVPNLNVVPLAVMSTKRVASHPNIPTFTELGFSAVVVSDYHALMAPRGTSPLIVDRLHRAMVESQNLTVKLQSQGMVRVSYSSQESTELLKSDMELRRATVTAGLIKLD